MTPGLPAQVSPSPAGPDLGAVAEPLVDGLDESARDQLREARAATEAAISDRAVPQALQSMDRLCLLYLRFELLESAEACMLQMSDLSPRDFRWPYYLMVLYDRGGDLEQALRRGVASLELRPDHPAAWIRVGDLALGADDLDGAEQAYQKALELDPTDSAAHFGLGRIRAEQGDFEEAVERFRKALEAQPTGSVVHHHLGMAYRELGDLDSAREELSKNKQEPIALFDPLMDQLNALGVKSEELFERGVRALRAGRPSEASEILREVLAVDPSDADAHYSLSRALLDLDDLEGAEIHLRRVVELDPTHGRARVNLAILLGRTDRFAESIVHLEQAVLSDPQNLGWRVMWARVLADSGQLERAAQELQTVVAADGALPEARATLGAVLAALGRPRSAIEHFEKLLELTPDDVEGHRGLGMALYTGGDWAGTQRALDEARAKFPHDLALTMLQARLLATSPDPQFRDGTRAVELAQQVMEQQLTLDAADTLAMALAEAGRFDDAVLWQQRVIERERGTTGAVTEARQSLLELYQQKEPYRASAAPER